MDQRRIISIRSTVPTDNRYAIELQPIYYIICCSKSTSFIMSVMWCTHNICIRYRIWSVPLAGNIDCRGDIYCIHLLYNVEIYIFYSSSALDK